MRVTHLVSFFCFGIILINCGGTESPDQSPMTDASIETTDAQTQETEAENDNQVESDIAVENDTETENNNNLLPEVNSTYLQNPDNAISVVRSLADFRARARDNSDGGFFSYLKQDGSLGRSATASNGSNWQIDHKSFITQTRDIYTFTRAFMLTGDMQYLDHANHAYQFLIERGYDASNDRWYFVANKQGDPADCPDCSQYWNPNEFNWSFVQHYAPLGPGVLCEATQSKQVCERFSNMRSTLNRKMWDNTNLGYYARADVNYSNPENKSFASIVDALNTHTLQAELLQPSGSTKARVRDLANLTTTRFVSSIDDSQVRFGFPDTFTTDWRLIPSESGGQVGHLLKAAWQLGRAYLSTGDARYRLSANKAILEILDNGGWDDSTGVPYTAFDWTTGTVNTSATEYWQIEQAVNAGLLAWYINPADDNRLRYISMADRSLQFFANHVIDWSNGGTYMLNSPSGAVVDSDKGNSYKAEFHSTEMFYYVHLYGNLMLQRKPVTLHYRVESTGTPQTIQFNPLEIDNNSLYILSAKLDNQTLTTFTANTRTVVLTADQGAHFNSPLAKLTIIDCRE